MTPFEAIMFPTIRKLVTDPAALVPFLLPSALAALDHTRVLPTVQHRFTHKIALVFFVSLRAIDFDLFKPASALGRHGHSASMLAFQRLLVILRYLLTLIDTTVPTVQNGCTS